MALTHLTGQPLDPRHRMACDRVFSGVRIPQVAEELGVRREQIYAWLRRSDVRAYMADMYDQHQTALLGSLQEVGYAAIAALGRVLEDPESSNKDIVAAAKVIFGGLGMGEGGPKQTVHVAVGASGAPGTPATGQVSLDPRRLARLSREEIDALRRALPVLTASDDDAIDVPAD